MNKLETTQGKVNWKQHGKDWMALLQNWDDATAEQQAEYSKLDSPIWETKAEYGNEDKSNVKNQL